MTSGQPTNGTLPLNNQSAADKGKDAQVDEGSWDEQELGKAMDTLNELQVKLRSLRTTMPKILAPLATKHATRKRIAPEQDPFVNKGVTAESLFQEFSAAKSTANLEVQQFRKLVEGPESTKVLAYASKSRAKRPKGIKPWRVTDHPNWATSKTAT